MGRWEETSQVTYDHGTVVRLTAAPAAGWYFVEWTGDVTGPANPADITMDGNKTVTAVFFRTPHVPDHRGDR